MKSIATLSLLVQPSLAAVDWGTYPIDQAKVLAQTQTVNYEANTNF